nr:hypothetical protein [Tanacetum cinerariifolium]
VRAPRMEKLMVSLTKAKCNGMTFYGSSSSAHVEPSPYTPNPVTIIPGPAGRFNLRRTSLTGFLAQSIRSSNAMALDSPYLLVLNTRASQSRQHESRKSPTAELFDVDYGRISIITVNTKEYHSECSGNYH